MLYLYNENDNPVWELKSDDSRFLRLQLIERPEFGINIQNRDIKKEDFNMAVLESTNNVYDVNRLADFNSSIHFDVKSLRPTIMHSDEKYNSDIYIASFDITDGSRVINLVTSKAYIYNSLYDYDAKMLHVIFSLNKKADKTFLEFIFEDKDKKNVFIRHFMINAKSNLPKVVARSMSLSNPIERGKRGHINPTDHANGTKYNIKRYVPLRPTKLIFFDKNEDKEAMCNAITSTFKYDMERSELQCLEGSDVREVVKGWVYNKNYRCATYYVPEKNREEIRADADFRKSLLDDKYAKLFDVVLVLCNDSWVVRIK